MASPLREPPALHDKAIQDLSFIRRTMEGAASFTDVPGWGLVIIGATAIVAAAVATQQPSAGRWLTVWVVELTVAVLTGGGMMWRKMRRRGAPDAATPLTVPARKFLLGLMPGLTAGAALSFAMIQGVELWAAGTTVPRLLPGLWLLLYGVGVVTAGMFSVRPVPLLGLVLMALGVVTVLVPAVPASVALGVGFGAVQIVFGVVIARRHGG